MGNTSYYRYNRIPDEVVSKIPHLVEVEKLTQSATAALLGISRNVVERYCKKHGLKTQRSGPRSGEGHPEWKGGRSLVGGYWYIYTPDHPNATKNHRVAEHRLVMESKLGRYLERQEVVHHIDGDSQNNHPDNLMVFQTNAAHLAVDLKGRVPNWTPEGKAAMAAMTEKKRKYHGTKEERTRQAWQHYDTVHRNRGRDDNQPPLPIAHQS